MRPDAAASAQLDQTVTKPVFFIYMDFATEPVRANTAGADITRTGTGDPEIDDFLFDGLTADILDVSPVKFSEGGTDSVTVTLSAAVILDGDMRNVVGDKSNYQGRVCRLWRLIREENNVQKGAIQNYYTGYMTGLDMNSNPPTEGAPSEQTITMRIEGWIAAYSAPSFRSYLDQEKYDPGDLSAKAAIAIANGTSGNPIVNNTATGGSSSINRTLDQWRAISHR